MRTSVLFLVFALADASAVFAGPPSVPSNAQSAAVAPPRVQTRQLRPAATVPNVAGLPHDAATRALAAARLTVGRVIERESDRPRGTVLDQRPAPGTRVPMGGAVDLLVSTGRRTPPPEPPNRADVRRGDPTDRPQRVDPGELRQRTPDPKVQRIEIEVPSVVGLHRKEAERVLASRDLDVGRIVERESRRDRDTVLDQQPKPGARVRLGSVVDLLVSTGEAPDDVRPSEVEVPPLVGRHVRDAAAPLDQRSLRLGNVKVQPSPRPDGVVLAQSPTSGVRVKPGTLVHVLVSQQVVEVPPVVGRRIDDASDAVRTGSLQPGRIETTPSEETRGTVIAQSPRAGTRVEPGSRVDFVVSEGPPLVPVPDLVSGRFEQAEALLPRRRLALGPVERRESRADAGVVLAQSPPAGTRVPIGTPVRVLVSAGDPLTEVPNVVRSTADAAIEALDGSELRVGRVDRRVASVRADIVLAQSPPAGARVPRGTLVSLTVSAGPPPPPPPNPPPPQPPVSPPPETPPPPTPQAPAPESPPPQPPAPTQPPPQVAVPPPAPPAPPPPAPAPPPPASQVPASPPPAAPVPVVPPAPVPPQAPPPPDPDPAAPQEAESLPVPVVPPLPPAPPAAAVPIEPVEAAPPAVPPWIWPWLATLGFAVLYAVQRIRTAVGSKPPAAGTPLPPHIALLPRLDVGTQAVTFAPIRGAHPAFTVTFRPDAGRQRFVNPAAVRGATS